MVEIFKTDIRSHKQSERIRRRLEHRFPDYRINFDLEDRDNILRVENVKIEVAQIIEVLAKLEVSCEWFKD